MYLNDEANYDRRLGGLRKWAKLLDYLYSELLTRMGGAVYFFTFTFKDWYSVERFIGDGGMERFVNVFMITMRRRYRCRMFMSWWLEFQRRGVPHYHMYVWFERYMSLESLIKPDKEGLWRYGMTNRKYISRVSLDLGYAVKYVSKGEQKDFRAYNTLRGLLRRQGRNFRMRGGSPINHITLGLGRDAQEHVRYVKSPYFVRSLLKELHCVGEYGSVRKDNKTWWRFVGNGREIYIRAVWGWLIDYMEFFWFEVSDGEISIQLRSYRALVSELAGYFAFL